MTLIVERPDVSYSKHKRGGGRLTRVHNMMMEWVKDKMKYRENTPFKLDNIHKEGEPKQMGKLYESPCKK